MDTASYRWVLQKYEQFLFTKTLRLDALIRVEGEQGSFALEGALEFEYGIGQRELMSQELAITAT